MRRYGSTYREVYDEWSERSAEQTYEPMYKLPVPEP